MQAAREDQVYETATVLFLALELSSKSWVLQFGDGRRQRRLKIAAGDLAGFGLALEQTRARWKLEPKIRVVSCYEAGRDGFWIHRALQAQGVENYVVESASIQVDRRARRVKTDRVDAEKLLQSLMRWYGGPSASCRSCGCPRRKPRTCASCIGTVSTRSGSGRGNRTGSGACWRRRELRY